MHGNRLLHCNCNFIANDPSHISEVAKTMATDCRLATPVQQQGNGTKRQRVNSEQAHNSNSKASSDDDVDQ
jgi:hypothetical protein